MTDPMLKLLGDVVEPRPDGRDLRTRVEAAVLLAVDGTKLPAEIETALNGFMEQASEDRLRLVQRAVARSGLWAIGPVRFVTLVANLAADGHLELADAAQALAAVPRQERKHLSAAARHLLDVADAVVEDARDGVMEVEEDEVFREALRAFRTSNS
jgi:hypothetical protein